MQLTHSKEESEAILMENKRKSVITSRNQLPIAKKEDVDYNAEFADDNDRIASERASEADQRQES
jgi:hypothetical protein